MPRQDVRPPNKADAEHLVAQAAHDLRDPLHAARTALHLATQGGADRLSEEERSDLLQVARTNVERALRIVDSLRNLTAAATPLAMEDVSPGPALEEALAALGPEIIARGARILRGPLPRVRADSTQLGRVFQNLVSNALKFAGDQGLLIRVEGRREDDWVRFDVCDNGIGIVESETDVLFAPFRRGSNTADRPGTGLGLAICQRIVEAHGGRMGLIANPTGGTTAWFTLPAAHGTDPSHRV